MTARILIGDCRETLRTLPTASVHCCVTSPPYYGLRDYHSAGQIGQEPTPDAYVSELVAVFREVRRVLRYDGTLWLNLGDCYSTHTAGNGPGAKGAKSTLTNPWRHTELGGQNDRGGTAGLPEKNLLLMPYRVASALQADGWFLRADIVWSKPNAMPESVSDRPTKSHEFVFLLSKSRHYYYDGDAIREPNAEPKRAGRREGKNALRRQAEMRPRGNLSTDERYYNPLGRNARSVWEIATRSFHDAHFATMPPALALRCILAGCPVGGTVLDPFGGAGTTAFVASGCSRDAVLCELNPEYADLARDRLGLFTAPDVANG